MKPSRLLLMIAVALMGAALLAGCGGPSKKEYEKEVRAIGADVEEEIDKLGEGAPTPDTLERATSTLEGAADDIEDVEPPSEVEELHDDLVTTLRDTADLLGRLGPLMEQASKDPSSLGEKERAQMEEITSDFEAIEKEMDRITKGYEKRDYDIGLGEGDSGK